MKTCSMCKKVKPFAEFHRDRSRSDGCQRQCRECKTVIAALRRRADLDAYAKAQRDWRAANPEAARRIRKRHYDLKARGVLLTLLAGLACWIGAAYALAIAMGGLG